MYTPLYVKSNYSFLSSLVKIDELIDKCLEYNIKSVALCDNNMIATMYFYKKCIEKNIKPIIALEILYKELSILLYAKNFVGYKNLLKILSRATEFLDSKKNFNDVDMLSINYDLLNEYSNDLICIIPFESNKIFTELKDVFSDIYLGYSSLNEEASAIKITSRIVFLNKVLYLNKSDSKYFKYSIMMKEKKNVLDNIEYKDNNNYFINPNNISNFSSNSGIDTTNFISSLCNLEFPKFDSLIPIYKNNFNVSSDEYLTRLSIQGITIRLGGEVSDVYKKRLLYELDVIKNMGFSDYFLIVYDYVRFAKKNGILIGPGRGSAGGSLVAYALGIIDINPIEYDLIFERFLNPGRDTMPDIDVDFPDSSRAIVRDYVREKYGDKKVAGIIAVATLQAKAVLDDVSKVLKITQDKTDMLKKMINKNLINTYETNYDFKNIIDNDDRLSLLYDVSKFYEGFPKNTTTHASGVIISKIDIDDVVPLIKKDGMYISSFEMNYLEELGFLKMDFLGNSHLTTIMNILDSIKKYEGIDVDFLNIPLDDRDTLKLFFDTNTNGIFHFDKDSAMKNLIKKLKIRVFDDIVAAEALVRPGPDTETYIKRKNERLTIKYPSIEIEKILSPTYGVITYQEQIMQIANVMAGFSLQEADILRWAMSKKKKKILASQEEKFISGAIKKGYSYEIAKKFYNDILAFAEYGFNKSHSVAYAIIAYKMGYLKAHYAKYFYLNVLTSIDGANALSYVRDARSAGVNFLLPSINISSDKYEIINDSIIFPLSSIRGIDANKVREFLKYRNENFSSVFDAFIKLVEANFTKSQIESLVYASCFDEFGFNKNTLISNLDNLLTYAFISKGIDSDIIEKPSIVEKEEFSRDILMAKEKDLFGFYLSHHPTSLYKDKFRVINLVNLNEYYNKTVDVLILVEKIKNHTDKKGNVMAFITGSDEVSSCEFIVFSSVFDSISEVSKGDIVLIRGKVDKKDNYQIIVEKAKIIA